MVTLFGAIGRALGNSHAFGLVFPAGQYAQRAAVAVVAGIALSILLVAKLPAEGSLLGIHWVKETAIFLASAVFTLVTLYGVSAITRMSESERQRVALFQRRLATPVGQLPEDPLPAGADSGALFAFRIVGVSSLLVGC